MAQTKNILGKRFGRLTVIERVNNDSRGGSRWLCKCECGNTKEVGYNNLSSGQVKSCGCLRRETSGNRNKTHGLSRTRLYNIYTHMIDRCYRKTDKRYNDYGGRGITVCEEWLSDFLNFYNWSINNGYEQSLSIDRINNNGNYEPTNCRWVTNKEQCRNYSRNVSLTYNNETHCLIEWSEILGISYHTIKRRYKKGLPIEQVLSKRKLVG